MMTRFYDKISLLRVGIVLILFSTVTGGGVPSLDNDSDNAPTKPPPPFVPPKTTTPSAPTTQLSADPLQSLLIVNTLDGSLTALDMYTGEQRWISPDKPMIEVPETPASIGTNFLPDPQSGSLYMMTNQNSPKKLPLTIPQFVAKAPCRNSEGLMYTGSKQDVWVSLNPYTGERHDFLDTATCPAGWGSEDHNHCDAMKGPFKTLLIGKTKYTLSMRDGPTNWNVSYSHYSAKEPAQDYQFVHFTSPSDGSLITYDKGGELLWQVKLSSPVRAVYNVEQAGMNLAEVPFTSFATDTLERFLDSGQSQSSKTLSQTTYVGHGDYGIYAFPALADEQQMLITSTSALPRLIEGPSGNSNDGSRIPNKEAKDNNSKNIYVFGYYEVNNEGGSGMIPQQIEGSKESIPEIKINDSKVIPLDDVQAQVNEHVTTNNPEENRFTNPSSPNNLQFPPPPPVPRIERKQEIKIVFTTAIISIAITSSILGAIFIFYRRYKNNQLEMQVKMLSNDSGVLMGDSSARASISINNELIVGKITIFQNEILGKGCEGTFVFKGTFEGRNVAVKRILPECFQFADREVDLLKESDQHMNVIRYFCTETDGQFRYIALELCVATLADWVEGRWEHEIDPVELIRGASEGLSYLHSLRIVHRDVKPANVLLSLSGGGVRTMISDFGLCKKIQVGRGSYSRRSGGVPGTDGWIAPEVLCYMGEDEGMMMLMGNTKKRMTYSVDIFSMGCVYYYVLSKGSHPFGDPFRRQSNILSGTHNIEQLSTNTRGAMSLVSQMISMDPSSRPPLDAVLQHPLFWSPDKILSFFLDVSDRIEKESKETCPILRRFESAATDVVRGDWRDHICSHVALDLRRYRTYKGESVRDLLRALRNKKNHYRELNKEVKESLGEIPDGFVQYWVGRFPKLLEYTWTVFESVKGDMKGYYSERWDFGDGEMCAGWGEDEDEMNDEEKASSDVKINKDFWKSKSQDRYQRWRGRGRGRGSPRRFGQQPPTAPQQQHKHEPISELSASTDNYWRSKSPGGAGGKKDD